jgi:hypothetical protein
LPDKFTSSFTVGTGVLKSITVLAYKPKLQMLFSPCALEITGTAVSRSRETRRVFIALNFNGVVKPLWLKEEIGGVPLSKQMNRN